ncbi:MAG: Fic family protein [Planctomycetota bacterium]|nr:Fic family protein [Planctomycetota bacterium]
MAPPFEVTSKAQQLLARLERLLGRYEGLHQPVPTAELRRRLRVESVRSTVAIEGNTLSSRQVDALWQRSADDSTEQEIVEAHNALSAYEQLPRWNPANSKDLLEGHRVMMAGLLSHPGRWRRGNVGVMSNGRVAHIAPPANRVAGLINELAEFIRESDAVHPAVLSAVVHYELEFIHPFEDGNGRMGRLWHTLILSRYHLLFQFVPVESVFFERRPQYFAALRESDRQGKSTTFVEFALQSTVDAVAKTLDQIALSPVTVESRINTARSHFGMNDFIRRDYLAIFPKLSTATASRDLKWGVDQGILVAIGEFSQTRYRFR